MANTRIYVVKRDTAPVALVSARSEAEAILHVTRNQLEAETTDPAGLAKLIGAGMRVMAASAPLRPLRFFQRLTLFLNSFP